MLTTYQRDFIKDEMRYNARGVYWHFRFFFKLLGRYLNKSVKRSNQAVYDEYTNVWDEFWQDRIHFSNDRYPFLENGQPMEKMISPFEYQLNVIDKMIAGYIAKHQYKRILEVGSGTGLHILNLAPQFPDVHFYGVELTKSGVEWSRKLLENPPVEFEQAHKQGRISNATIIHGDILKDETVKVLQQNQYDFVYTTLVLEQLQNYLDVVFTNIFKLDLQHFLFHEQWFEFNTYFNKYRMLLNFDYFRAPLALLNKFPARVIESTMPAIQPMGMNVVGVFGEKKQ